MTDDMRFQTTKKKGGVAENKVNWTHAVRVANKIRDGLNQWAWSSKWCPMLYGGPLGSF